MYDAPLDGINQSEAEMHLTLTFEECTDNNKLEAKHGVPINVIVDDGNKAYIQLFADFSGIRSICFFLVNKVFPFADIDKESLLFQALDQNMLFRIWMIMAILAFFQVATEVFITMLMKQQR